MSYQKAALRLAIFSLVLAAANLSGFAQDPRQASRIRWINHAM